MQTLTLPIEDNLTLSAEEARGMSALLAQDFNQAVAFLRQPRVVCRACMKSCGCSGG
ncbi:hypothetical protein [Comamonas badia]|uniref:hypothetical protein n=1 Tax=Comamonas badia TaxID=265291 RepID=UPI00040EC8D3|nr:hypothetical protein [Comamonas badia]